jgi:Tfp pilus assembly protein PilF
MMRSGFGISLLLFACALGALSGCVTSHKNREEAELHMQIGTGHLERRNYPLALHELQTAADLDPDNPRVQNNLGLAFFLLDRYELAEKALRRAVELAPKYNEARDNLGRVLIELGRNEEAIRELRTVLSDLTYPAADRAWTNMGLAYFRRADFGQARAKFAEAIRLNRENCLAQTLFGRSLLEMGDFRAATDSLDGAIRICKDAQFDEPHYFSGLSYLKLGDTGRGLARLEEAIKLFPHGKYAQRAKSMLQQIK